MSTIITLQAVQPATSLRDNTRSAFLDLPRSVKPEDTDVFGVGVDLMVSPDQSTLIRLAEHGYYSTQVKYRRKPSKLGPDQKLPVFEAASRLLLDDNMTRLANEMSTHTAAPQGLETQMRYELVQMRHLTLMRRYGANLNDELALLKEQGKGLPELIRSLVVVGFPKEHLSAHQILRETAIATRLLNRFLTFTAACTSFGDRPAIDKMMLEIVPPVRSA
jgi:hypothetical protein